MPEIKIGGREKVYSGAYAYVRVPVFIWSVSLCISVAFLPFTDRESCTRLSSPNPGSMESGEFGL